VFKTYAAVQVFVRGLSTNEGVAKTPIEIVNYLNTSNGVEIFKKLGISNLYLTEQIKFTSKVKTRINPKFLDPYPLVNKFYSDKSEINVLMNTKAKLWAVFVKSK
jgi:hypothetical protein